MELEGKISAITPGDAALGTADTITVLGVTVDVTGLPIATPTGSLTFADLTTGPSLIGATGIILGDFSAASGSVASSVFIELAEHVMFGTITNVTDTDIFVNNTGQVRINAPGSGVGDDRFAAVVYPSPGFTVLSETGYPMAQASVDTTDCVPNPDIVDAYMPVDSTRPCAITAGDLLSAEGDYRTTEAGSYLAAHTVEVGKGVLYNPANVAGNRDYVYTLGDAERDGGRISLRGYGTFAGGRVYLFRATADCVIGSAIVNGNGVQLNTAMGADSGVYKFDKASFSGDRSFTNVIVRTSNGATACTGVIED